MAIGVANKIGDEIIYTLKPLGGISSINSFTDVITGETVTRYFRKYVSVAIEGLFFTDYKLLTNTELQAILINKTNSYVLKIKYVRAGTDNTGSLTLHNFVANCTKVEIDSGYEYNNSNFVRFFDMNNEDVLEWSVNVFKKIFKHGSLAEYVLRGKMLTEINEDQWAEFDFSFDQESFD